MLEIMLRGHDLALILETFKFSLGKGCKQPSIILCCSCRNEELSILRVALVSSPNDGDEGPNGLRGALATTRKLHNNQYLHSNYLVLTSDAKPWSSRELRAFSYCLCL